MNKEAIKELAKEQATILGSQILSLIGKALINFANQVANPKKTYETESIESFNDRINSSISVMTTQSLKGPNFEIKADKNK